MAHDGLPFRKMNGLGNEILVVDLRTAGTVLSAAEAARIASRPDTRFDQLMALHAPRVPGTAAYVRIYNADGSPAGACGNGTRCIAYDEAERTGSSAMLFETDGGLLACTVESASRVTVDMGEPRFDWRDIPLAEEFRDTRAIELQVGPIDKPLIHSPSVVNVGNPHAIFWVERLDVVDLGKVGPMLEHHRLFPERANISLARVVSRSEIHLKVWERGAGLTLACGSAACAAAVAAARTKRTDRHVRVVLPGGPLEIEWRADNHILMTGPVAHEHAGVIPWDLLDHAVPAAAGAGGRAT
ncbi:MAG: diaminopimelate epimerase [Hyphomicrobiaceae bacterium]